MIKSGVIGVGHMGKHHARILAEIPECELIGVCDIDKDKGQKIAKEYNCTYHGNIKELLSKTDAVIIATPTNTHRKITIEALNKGNHVLVEKPISLDLKEADEIITAASRNNLILQVGHIERFNPAILASKKVVQNPLFIEAHRLSPFYGRGVDVSVVLDLMVHDLDIILNYVKSPVKHISAGGVPVLTNYIDIANARLEFENGAIANITASRISLMKLRKIRFWQKYSYVSVDTLNRKVGVFYREINNGQPEIKEEDINVPTDEPLLLQNQSFIDACIGKKDIEVTPEEAKASLALAHKILDKIVSRAKKLDFKLEREEYPL
ncbi:Gfo/Idh/MocA family oxidoreductase [candidate division WOR-3 bacterium]|nr:Gfo/Idh/MocA family oxidoreductase [candidate division WOR-3 bacterium]